MLQKTPIRYVVTISDYAKLIPGTAGAVRIFPSFNVTSCRILFCRVQVYGNGYLLFMMTPKLFLSSYTFTLAISADV